MLLYNERTNRTDFVASRVVSMLVRAKCEKSPFLEASKKRVSPDISESLPRLRFEDDWLLLSVRYYRVIVFGAATQYRIPWRSTAWSRFLLALGRFVRL